MGLAGFEVTNGERRKVTEAQGVAPTANEGAPRGPDDRRERY